MQAVKTLAGWMLAGVFLAGAGLVQAQDGAQQGNPPQAKVQGQAAAPAVAHFDVLEFRVEGVTLLPAGTVERAVYPFMGPGKSLDDVQKASEALEKIYHDAGYLTVLVTIPQQKVDDGVVMLQVTEATVNRLRVEDSRYFSPAQIKAALPAVAEGTVPNFSDMQDQMGVVGRDPDRRITPVLRAGQDSGTVDVDLKVEDQLPLHGAVDVNNRYTPPGLPTHADASLHWDNLWGLQHSIGLSVQTVPEDPTESTVYTLNYNMPLPSGNSLAMYAVNSNSNLLYSAINTINVSNGHVYGFRYVANLPALGSLSETATFGADYKAFGQTTLSTAGGGYDTPITYLPMTAGWDGSWQGQGSSSKFGIALNFHSSDFVGAESDFANKAYKAHSNYTYFKGSADHTESFSNGWGLDVRSSWQLSGVPLISNEQFFIGGADTVRGYTESIASGDDGLTLTLEASTPSLLPHGGQTAEGLFNDVHGVIFVDSGAVQLQQPLDPTAQRVSLVGAGVGIRATGSHGLSLVLDSAWAQRSLGGVTPPVHVGDTLVHFRVAYEW